MNIKQVENKIEYAHTMLEEFTKNWEEKWNTVFSSEDKSEHEIQFNIEALCMTHIYHYFVTKILLSSFGIDELAYELGILEELEFDDSERIKVIEQYTGEEVVFYKGDELFSGKDISVPYLIRQRETFPQWLNKDEFYTLIFTIDHAANSYKLLCSEFENSWYDRVVKCNSEEKQLLLNEFFESLSEITNIKRKPYFAELSSQRVEHILEKFQFIDHASDLIKLDDIHAQ